MQVTTIGRIVMRWQRRVLTLAFASVVVLTLMPQLPVAGQEASDDETQEQEQAPRKTSAQLQQLVAPIALYPDALVAQILAAATYPTTVVQANRWLQEHPKLQGAQLASAVDQQRWDPSVKALTAFPLVLANLDKNLSWTEELGDAYFNQQQDVLDAVQIMRQRAKDAGNLRSTPQERVVDEGSTILIEPAYDNLVYVPNYDPWIVYGAPFGAYPGYSYAGWSGRRFSSFGPGVRLGFFGGFGWGWPAWGLNWGSRAVVFNHNTFFSHNPFFFRRGPFIGAHGIVPRRSFPPARFDRGFNNPTIFNNRPAFTPTPRFGNGWSNRGSFAPRMDTMQRTGAFNGARSGAFNRGSVFRSPSMGRSSFSGGRSFGGGSRGGGGRHR